MFDGLYIMYKHLVIITCFTEKANVVAKEAVSRWTGKLSLLLFTVCVYIILSDTLVLFYELNH